VDLSDIGKLRPRWHAGFRPMVGVKTLGFDIRFVLARADEVIE
jgi:hypothetical protein